MQGIAVKGLCFLCVEQNNKNTDNKTRVGIPCSRLWRRLPNKEFPTVRCGCLPTVAAGNRIVLQTLRGQRQKTLRAVCFGLWVDTHIISNPSNLSTRLRKQLLSLNISTTIAKKINFDSVELVTCMRHMLTLKGADQLGQSTDTVESEHFATYSPPHAYTCPACS